MNLQPTTKWGDELLWRQTTPNKLSLVETGGYLADKLAMAQDTFPGELADAVRVLFQPIVSDAGSTSPLQGAIKSNQDKVKGALTKARKEVAKVFDELIKILGLETSKP